MSILGFVRKKMPEMGFAPIAPKEWEHGWETIHVRASRYSNKYIGFNIGFIFPKHPYDCDRADLIEFINVSGDGCVYQCGGHPGAEVFATFRGVKDIESANAMLKEFLPRLEKFMASMK